MPIGYHFTGDTLRDGRPIPAIGEKLVHEGPIEICASGLHGSDEPFDALRYAPGPLLHRVEYAEPVERQSDKWVSRERTILASIDATSMLRRFAADQALSVAHVWDMPDVVREYLTTLNENLRHTARDAAWDAAWAAAWDAERDAAWGAAWDAARDAAWAAAWDAARDAARHDFNTRVYAAFGVAA